jgi:hypothetical protein
MLSLRSSLIGEHERQMIFFPQKQHWENPRVLPHFVDGKQGKPSTLIIRGLTPRGDKIFEPMTSSVGDSFKSDSEPLELTLGAPRGR